MASFHSVSLANLPSSGAVGDVYFCTTNSLLYCVVGDTSLVQLLVAIPVPVAGPIGPKGDTGATGAPFTSVIQFSGDWAPSPVGYTAGAVVNYNSFLYLALAPLNISTNVMPPEGNPFWKILAPSATVTGKESAIVCIVDGNGTTPTTGTKALVQLPANCVVSSYSIFADQPGSAQFDVKWATYDNLPSTVSITGVNPPALSNAQKSSLDISGLWNPKIFNATDCLEIDLVFVQTCTILTLQIFVIAL